MTSPTLAPPRRPPGRPLPEPPQAPGTAPRRWARPRHHAAAGRVWRWGLGVSVLVHLLVLVLSPAVLRVGLPPGDADAPRDTGAARGMRMVDLAQGGEAPAAPLPSDEALAEDLPTPPRIERAAPRATPPGAQPARPGDAPGTRAPAPAGGTGDNPLQPGLRDSRLWITPREIPKPEPTQEELHAQYMSGLEARINALNDSIAGDAERARRATDWTVRDGEGRRWGVSPDGIHLGGITIPSAGFPPGGGDPDKRARAEEQQRAREEIDRQEADTERRRVREERIRATRERNDRERQERNPPR